MIPDNVIPLRITPKRQGLLESELRAHAARHRLIAALAEAVIILHDVAQAAQDEADRRAAALATAGFEQEAAND